MLDYDNIFFNAAAFIGGLFVLEFGADKFIDNTAKVAARLRIAPVLIALLTSGAEWDELIVVIAAISQRQSSLAIGNIFGSSIANILGAFSLGLIFSPTTITFDRSSKIYTAVLLALTSLFAVFILFFQSLGRVGGAILVATFAAYVASIGWAIYKGVVAPPEDDSDSDSDSDSDVDHEIEHEEQDESEASPSPSRTSSTDTLTETTSYDDSHKPVPLDKAMFEDAELQIISGHSGSHSTLYYVAQLTIGFLALSLSGYVLSHSISTLADAFSLSGTVLGITILSFATTLPEKFVSILSGTKKQGGIIVANTAGSNIFLITLCAGALFLAGDLQMLQGSVNLFEVATMWFSSLLLFVVVMTGGRKWMGWTLFSLYLAFIVFEFTAPRD